FVRHHVTGAALGGTQHFSRVSGTFRHRHHLVATIAFPILSAALLRCLGAKFLSLQCRLHRDRTLCRLSHSARQTAVRSSRVRPLSDPSSPKRRPSNHPNDCPLLQRSRRLRHFHPFFGDHDRATCSHFLPEERHILRQWQFEFGTLLGLLGAIGVLVSTRGYRRARRYSRIVDCLYRDHLLGALWCPGKTSICPARFHS